MWQTQTRMNFPLSTWVSFPPYQCTWFSSQLWSLFTALFCRVELTANRELKNTNPSSNAWQWHGQNYPTFNREGISDEDCSSYWCSTWTQSIRVLCHWVERCGSWTLLGAQTSAQGSYARRSPILKETGFLPCCSYCEWRSREIGHRQRSSDHKQRWSLSS